MPQVKVNTGSWVVPKAVKVWNGTSWIRRIGKYWNGSSWVPFISFESWSNGAAMPTGRRILAQAGYNGIVYAIGGLNSASTGIGTNEAYDVASNTWSTKTPMTYAKHGVRAVESGGKIYAVGGYYSSSSYTNQQYDPATNTWSQRTAMPNWADGLAVEKRSDGKIHAITGMRMLTRYGQHYQYDPNANIWMTLADMPSGRAYPSSASLGDDIYVLNGDPSNGLDGKVYKYSNASNSWVQAANLIDPYDGLAAGGLNGKIYAAGNNYEIYTPETNTWAQRSVAGVIDGCGMCVMGGKLFCIGGGSYSTQNKILTL